MEPDLREVDSVQGIALQAYAWFKTIASEQDPVDPAALDRVDEYLSDLHDRVGPIVANYRSQLAGYRNHAIGLEGALTHFRNELGASQARHQDAVNQAAKLEARHEEVLSEVSRLQATTDSALARSLTLENELSEASADRERLAAELEATKSELAAARKQLIDAESNNAALSDQILALGARVDRAENARL